MTVADVVTIFLFPFFLYIHISTATKRRNKRTASIGTRAKYYFSLYLLLVPRSKYNGYITFSFGSFRGASAIVCVSLTADKRLSSRGDAAPSVGLSLLFQP